MKAIYFKCCWSLFSVFMLSLVVIVVVGVSVRDVLHGFFKKGKWSFFEFGHRDYLVLVLRLHVVSPEPSWSFYLFSDIRNTKNQFYLVDQIQKIISFSSFNIYGSSGELRCAFYNPKIELFIVYIFCVLQFAT